LFVSACSEVKFSQHYECEAQGTCVVQNGKAVYPSKVVTIEGGNVDILIVNDNSASMSFEQQRMADRFGQFINNLEKKNINYRIGFTTTDISSTQNKARDINQNGGLQDGNLISLSNGKKFLSSGDGTIAEKINIFNSAIKRPETLTCENFIRNWINSGKKINEGNYNLEYYNNCPSGDERGIYAANLVIKNNPDSFLRDDADFQLIFLSDEDERSQLYFSEANYALTEMDKGVNLAQNIRTQFPNKNFGIHPIIVADEYCLPVQAKQLLNVVNGSYGYEYDNARKEAQNIVNAERKAKNLESIKMVLGDICSDDYSGQLYDIFNQVSGAIVDNIAIECANPSGLSVTVATSDSSISYEVVGNLIKFNKKLPVGTKVTLSEYSCPQ
ncbi:MAG: hypothetical protein L6Q37_13280, partial [Bdellovibrionaceae bacterium]|nr:hypothetical protein [Pseudobdellovibrionaceae bacterium]